MGSEVTSVNSMGAAIAATLLSGGGGIADLTGPPLWISERCMRNRSGSVVYSDRLNEVKLPILLLAAASDLQRPPDCVSETFHELGSADKRFLRAGVAEGFSVDFGHDDLLAGKAFPNEIFPIITDWLEERSRACWRSHND